MKYFVSLILLCLFGLDLIAQTAPNFVAPDCSGVEHDLYTELDAGKVIVLDWVMPCTECALPSLTAYSIVKNYQKEHPGRVLMYMIDDYANTNCTSLIGWASSYAIAPASFLLKFSTSKITMTDYGEPGMPKFVVVGGANHAMLYRAENGIDAPAVQAAIDAQLQQSTDVTESMDSELRCSVHPNPAGQTVSISVCAHHETEVDISVYDMIGHEVQRRDGIIVTSTATPLVLDVSPLESGLYTLRVRSTSSVQTSMMIIQH